MYGLFAIHGSFIFAKNKHKSMVKKGEKTHGIYRNYFNRAWP